MPGRLVGGWFRHDRQSRALRTSGRVPSQVVSSRPGARPRGRAPPGVPRNRNLFGRAVAGRCRTRAGLGELPVGDSYARLWGTELSIGFGARAITGDLRWWVSDGLMTVFFFLVGLELKREVVFGQLRDRRRAALPVVAAFGGMLVPAAHLPRVHVRHRGGPRGWGSRCRRTSSSRSGSSRSPAGPLGLKALLLSLAIVDDLRQHRDRGVRVRRRGGMASDGARARARRRLSHALVAPHPGRDPVRRAGRGRLGGARARARRADARGGRPGVPHARRALGGGPGTPSPLARAEAVLLPWSSYLIVPLFALANAGMRLSADAIAEATTSPLGLGILASRVIGKPLGVVLACLVAMRLGLGGLSPGPGRRAFVALGAVAGIPFTVSLFVARIALPAPLVGPATVSILLAALVAGVVGFVLVRRLGRAEPEAAPSPARPDRGPTPLYSCGPARPGRSSHEPNPEEVPSC